MKKVILVALLALLLWILFGIIVLIPFLPYLAYQKIFRYVPTYRGSYLLHRYRAQKGIDSAKAANKIGCFKFIMVLILTPVLLPLTYVSGIFYPLYFMLSSCFPAPKQAPSSNDSQTVYNSSSSMINQRRKRKTEKVHTEISLQAKQQLL